MADVAAPTGALIIDDDEDLLDTWQRLAEAKGLTVVTAATWDDGLALFHILSPELVIADYNLPGSQHGLRLLSEIRQLRPSVRLVLISGAVEPSELMEVERLEIVDRVLSKGDAAVAREAVIEEIERAAEEETCPTDWQAFANASLAAKASDPEKLESVDALLTSSVESNADD